MYASYLRYFIVITSLLVWGLPIRIWAQTVPQGTTFVCGFQPPSQADAIKLDELAKRALLDKRNKSGSTATITYVPIRPHIVRRSDGTGGFSLANLNEVMAKTNAYYLQNGAGMQFYFAGATPDYLDGDDYYTRSFGYVDVRFFLDPNALNQFYVPNLADLGGSASMPYGDQLFTTYSAINVYESQSSYTLNDLGNRVIPHELGHNFNLYHTFQNIPLGGTTDELVTRGAGANCTTAGDLLCDTPADPYGMPGASVSYPDGCPYYDPDNTARDANGDAYNPSLTNLMSYYLGCTHDFTPGQYDRMQAGLALRQTHTTYTLNYPSTPVTAPSNLVAQALANPTRISLTWQDNATNEMGYFVERSLSRTSGFVPVGGVAPDVTTFVDNTISPNTQYYYRIRPSNTTTDHLSPVAEVSAGYCRVVYADGCTGNNGLASVTINNVALSQNSGCSVGGYGQFTATVGNITVGQTNNFSLTLLDPSHPHGITIWADLNRNYSFDLGEDLYVSTGVATGTISGSFVIPNGITSGPMLLRVLSAYNDVPFYPCGSYGAGETEDYTIYVSQQPVSGLTTTNITGNTAQLNWNNLGDGIQYDLQWRQQGAPNWNTYTAYYTNTYGLSPLLINTGYEWQVREHNTTTFSGPVSFTTLCSQPAYFYSNPTRTTAYLSWGNFFYPPPNFTLRWRGAGASDWATTTIVAGTAYSLTGLTASTAYEWQVQTNCSTPLSWTAVAVQSFTTLACQAPYYTSTRNLFSSSVTLYWSANTEPGVTYRVQYRPVGNPAWQTVESLTTTTYSLTGLVPNTPYEWQVQSVCTPTESSSYVAGVPFTPLCPVPQQTFAYPTTTGVVLNFVVDPGETNQTFTVQYRPLGSTDWTTINSLTATGTTYRTGYLTGLSRNTPYEWRINTNCTSGIQSGYSAIGSFTTGCAPVSYAYTSLVAGSSAYLNWYALPQSDAQFTIQWRIMGSPVWTTVSNLTVVQTGDYYWTGSYLLTGLTNNTTYEWQIQTVCSPTQSASFVVGPSFTTVCPVPAGLTISGVAVTSATLNWTKTGADVQYEVNYRPVGATDWLVVSNITSNSLALSGLKTGISYNWQVRTLCGGGVASGFSTTSSFYTPGCTTPSSVTPVVASDYSALLRWYFYGANVDTRFQLQWRTVGNSNWNVINNLTISSISGDYSFVLAGLSPSTAYEWQVRVICSSTESSAFTTPVAFQTLAPCNGVMYTVKVGSWSDPSVWSCGRVPISSDTVQIKHVISIPSNYVANALTVHFDPNGKVSYSANGRLKLGY